MLFKEDETEDKPLGDILQLVFDHPEVLIPHLNAIRKHLLRSVLVLMLTTGLSFTFFNQILEFLTRPLPGGTAALQAIEVTEPLGTVMRVALFTGFAVAFPYLALEIFLFIAPSLSLKSQLKGLTAIPIATLFFIGGMAFAYFVMLPAALPFLLNFMGISTIPRPSNYVKFVTGLMFWIGVAFEFPLVIYLLALWRVVKAKMLAQQWRLAIVIIAAMSAMITPTVDPVNMALVMLPMIGLYVLSIALAFLAQFRRAPA